MSRREITTAKLQFYQQEPVSIDAPLGKTADNGVRVVCIGGSFCQNDSWMFAKKSKMGGSPQKMAWPCGTRNEDGSLMRLIRRQLVEGLVLDGVEMDAAEEGRESLYIPKPQLVGDRKLLQDFMDESSFAELVTATPKSGSPHTMRLDRSGRTYGTIHGTSHDRARRASAWSRQRMRGRIPGAARLRLAHPELRDRPRQRQAAPHLRQKGAARIAGPAHRQRRGLSDLGGLPRRPDGRDTRLRTGGGGGWKRNSSSDKTAVRPAARAS